VKLEAWAIPIDDLRSRELELVERHARGDESAFDEVYTLHSGRVYGLCLRLAGDPEEAFDLAQEVFLRVHRHLARFRGRSSLSTWIYRVTVNHCRSRLARRRISAVPLEEAVARGDEPRARGADPERLAVVSQASRRLGAALARLPLKLRMAVVLRDVEGLAYGEIASVLRVPVGTVRSRIARAREALRQELGDGG